MSDRRARRVLTAIIAVSALLLGTVAAAPAFADSPPLDWQPIPGASSEHDGLVVTLETALADDSPWGLGRPYAEPVPWIRPVIENTTDADRVVGFGIDIAQDGEVEPLWFPETWHGLLGDDVDDETLALFHPRIPAGGTLADAEQPQVGDGVPAWTGRTMVVYELVPPQTEGDPPEAVELLRYVVPGRFVPVRFDPLTDDGLPTVGQRLEIAGTGETSELFPGVTATVEASGLTAGEQLDLWLVQDYDYFFFFLLGGGLPADAVDVGAGTVAADGTLATTFVVPGDTPLGRYQLVAGDPSERYWPTGSHRYFDITEPAASSSVETPEGASTATLTFQATEVQVSFPAGTSAGTTTATVSATGPSPTGFTLAGNPWLYYHIASTANPGGRVTVCIAYDTANLPGDPPYLYHHASDSHQWENITTTREPGRVCGETDGFSPFALGIPDAPPDDGSAAPPAKGVLHSDSGWDTGLHDGDYNVVMNLWHGENARIVRLYENDALVASTELPRSTPNAQQAVFPITGRVNGTYVYKAELENSRGVTTTRSITVKVSHANPGTPVLSHDNWAKKSSFTLTANLWWGTNATGYRFLEGTTVVGQGTLSASSPNAQRATLALSGVSKGAHTYRVEFTNTAGATLSAPITVTVK